jgi:hypothetical protein
VIPLPDVPEPMGRVAFSPVDASPSRARLGRVAEMLREAEEATPPTRRRKRYDRDAGAVVPLVRRRTGIPVPSPRRPSDASAAAVRSSVR